MSTLSVDTIQGQTTAANVKLPAGSIIQTVTFTSPFNGSEISATTNSYVSTGSEGLISITPKYNNSKLIVRFEFNADTADSDNRALYTLYRSIGGASEANVTSNNSNSYDALARVHATGGRILMIQTLQYVDTVTSTAARTYRLYVKGQNANEVARVRNDITQLQASIMEISV